MKRHSNNLKRLWICILPFVVLALLAPILFDGAWAQPRADTNRHAASGTLEPDAPASPASPADCTIPPPTPEPLWVDPVDSPTTLFTQTVKVYLGRGRAITVSSEAGAKSITGTFSAYTPASVTISLMPNVTHHLDVEGRVEYAADCFYTLSTWQDRNYDPLIIVQQSTLTPTAHLPLILRNSGGPTLAGCQVFPPDNPWNTDISAYPLHPNSANFIADIDGTSNKFLHADFGSNLNYGIPYTIVASTQPSVPINFTAYGDESDPGPYPIPPNAPIEGGASSTGDRHVLVLEKDNCILYELYRAFYTNPGWNADSGAIFDLSSNALRTDGWTSADAAGLPILPGLVRYDEVEDGAIHHAVRFTVWHTQNGYIHPATHFASSSSDPNRPPMGLRLRLKASYDISGFTGQARVILEALKKYGMIVADNGSSWYITGASDARWDDDDLDQLKTVPGNQFEVVYTGDIVH